MAFGCVIDAGSSGTRIYVYKWPKRVFKQLPIPLTTVYKTPLFSTNLDNKEKKVRGISTYVDDPSAAGQALEPLISKAKNAIPGDVDLQTVPIYLGATAGMRVLAPEKANLIFDSIRTTLRKSGFEFKDSWASIISGEEEGAYGWIAANYLKQKLAGEDDKTTYGALDLGGASTQISFITNESILASTSTKDNIQNPCYPKGFNKNGFNGTSDWNACFEKTLELFDFQAPCYYQDEKPSRCSFNGVYQPTIQQNMKFIGMSTFYYTWKFLKLKMGADSDNLNKLRNVAETVCTKTLAQQNERNPNQFKLENQCFNAAYVYHLLHDGYHMDLDKTPVEVFGEIEGTEVTWCLGAIMMKANKLSFEYEQNNLYEVLFFVTLGLGILTLIIGLFFRYKSKKNAETFGDGFEETLIEGNL
eukprot:g1226.t1